MLNYGNTIAQSAITFGQEQLANVMEFGKGMVNGATTTITSLTPGPVLEMLKSVTSNADAIRQDPMATIKNYVPEYIIHTGERTYEIVCDAADSTKKNAEATSGFIVTKVNGVVESIVAVPVIKKVLDELKSVKQKFDSNNLPSKSTESTTVNEEDVKQDAKSLIE